MTARTGYVFDYRYLWHDTGTAAGLPPADPMHGVQPLHHFEHPDTKRRIHELLGASGLLSRLHPIEPRHATD